MSEVTSPSGLKFEDIVEGDGDTAKPGHSVTVHYIGSLANGMQFDSSLSRNEPFTFVLGEGRVITGWDEGVQNMKVGGRRKLVVPPHLGYGPRGAGNLIPPNATLVFDVVLLSVFAGDGGQF